MLNNLFKSKGFLFLWIISFALNIITFFLVFFNPNLHGPNVALKYNVRAGVTWYGQGSNLYYLPFFGLFLNLLNLGVFKKIQADPSFLKAAIVFTSISAQVILLVGLIFLSMIN